MARKRQGAVKVSGSDLTHPDEAFAQVPAKFDALQHGNLGVGRAGLQSETNPAQSDSGGLDAETHALGFRMLRVLERYSTCEAAPSARLAVVRSGAGHPDAAEDLRSLLDCVRPDDASGAPGDGEASSRDSSPPSISLLRCSLGRLRAVSRVAFQNEEEAEVAYPSLSAVRKGSAHTLRKTKR